MERCNRPAHRQYPNGYRVCWEHAHPADPAGVLHPDTIGPCDYPLDGYGAMRYDRRMRASSGKPVDLTPALKVVS